MSQTKKKENELEKKEYRVNISVEKSLDIIVKATCKEDAEAEAKANWEEQEEELNYGTEVTVHSVDCLDDDDEEEEPDESIHT